MATRSGSEPRHGRIGRSVGVVSVQALNSFTTVLQMVVFAALLPRGDFDDYAVWATSGMFLVGLGQAVGTDRVLVGRQSFEDGVHAVRTLAVLVTVVQVAVALALGNVALAVCSLAMLAYVTYDFQRLIRCFEEAAYFLRRDLVVVLTQGVVLVAAWAAFGRTPWLVLGWWGTALPLWFLFGDRRLSGVGHGLRVLRDDIRESFPLMVDATLGGLPVVAALALAKAQGPEGVASAARMAFTILGPVSVLAISSRRMIYRRAATGRLDRAFSLRWTGVVLVAFLISFGLLTLTRTPLYPWLLTGFVGLSWLAVLGFSANHATLFATMPQAARLRAERRAGRIGSWRIVATLASGGAAVALMPFDRPADVAWCVATGSLVYCGGLMATRPGPPSAEQPDPATPETVTP